VNFAYLYPSTENREAHFSQHLQDSRALLSP
jgi:hypothetical protein